MAGRCNRNKPGSRRLAAAPWPKEKCGASPPFPPPVLPVGQATSSAEHSGESRGTTRVVPSMVWVEAVEHGEDGWGVVAFEVGCAGAAQPHHPSKHARRRLFPRCHCQRFGWFRGIVRGRRHCRSLAPSGSERGAEGGRSALRFFQPPPRNCPTPAQPVKERAHTPHGEEPVRAKRALSANEERAAKATLSQWRER
jgi:hypothetical protein